MQAAIARYPRKKAGDYFAACINEKAVNAAALQPMQPALKRIGALDAFSKLPGLMAWLHLIAADNAMFHSMAEQDFTDSERLVLTLDAGGLGLSERDYYLRQDSRSKDTRAAYRASIAQMLMGDSDSRAQASATHILFVETALARASLSVEAQRDPRKLVHKMTMAQLSALAPKLDWVAYFAALQLPANAALNVA